MLRILLNILIIIFLFIFPVYISFILILASIFFINNFMEAIIWGFFLDLLYGSGRIFGVHFPYFFTLIILVFYLISFRLKTMLRLS